MKDYIRKMRSRLGKEKFIHPAARVIMENENGEILLLRRADNGNWGLPAGALEEGETIEACIKREVREETGLLLTGVEVIGISTNPNVETVRYGNGDLIQYFTIEFYSNSWIGSLKVNEREEVQNVQFMDRAMMEKLPRNELSALESLDFFQANQRVMLK